MTGWVLAFTFLTVFGCVVALSAPSQAEVLARRLGAGSATGAPAPGQSLRGRLDPLLGRLRATLYARTPSGMRAAVAARLAAAGQRMPVAELMVRKVVLGVVCGGLFALLLAGRGALPSAMGACFAAFVGWRLPDVGLMRAAAQRRLAIARLLPDGLDLLCTSVEAGLGLDGAMQQVADKLGGPLAEELAVYLRDARLGRPREESLQDLAARVDLPELRSAVGAIVQAERLGTSLARVLRIQSTDLRQHRRLAAQERAMRTPVLLLGPLVGFIFPAVFIVILGPAALQIMRSFHP